jgi:hypothetical protein
VIQSKRSALNEIWRERCRSSLYKFILQSTNTKRLLTNEYLDGGAFWVAANQENNIENYKQVLATE